MRCRVRPVIVTSRRRHEWLRIKSISKNYIAYPAFSTHVDFALIPLVQLVLLTKESAVSPKKGVGES
jgi:hypothetical protein